MSSDLATIYAWEFPDKELDMEYLLDVIGGNMVPTNMELMQRSLSRNPLEPRCCSYLTREFIIYQWGKVTVIPKLPNPGQKNLSPFSTPILEGRLGRLGLSLPDHELIFVPRLSKGYYTIDLKRVGGIGLHLMESLNAKDVLVVNYTDIEGSVLYASPGIEENVSASVRVG